MDFCSNACDFGNAPEQYVSGLRSITRISRGIMRVSYVTDDHRDTDGLILPRVCLHVLWDRDTFVRTLGLVQHNTAELCRDAWPRTNGETHWPRPN